MRIRIVDAVFIANLPLPNGTVGQRLNEDSQTKLWRDGDTLVVESHIPDNADRGFPVDSVREYNWAVVAYCQRAPEAALEGKPPAEAASAPVRKGPFGRPLKTA